MGAFAMSPTEWIRHKRKENAGVIALAVRMAARKAQARGLSNLITELKIAEHASALGISDADYALRTVKQIIKRDCAFLNELHLIAPSWGRKGN